MGLKRLTEDPRGPVGGQAFAFIPRVRAYACPVSCACRQCPEHHGQMQDADIHC